MIAEEPDEDHVKGVLRLMERIVATISYNPESAEFDIVEHELQWTEDLDRDGQPSPVYAT